LTAGAEVIVRGTIADAKPELTKDEKFVHTRFTLTPDNPWKDSIRAVRQSPGSELEPLVFFVMREPFSWTDWN
jgi:hypothetical protein